jgi:hypothetical protein
MAGLRQCVLDRLSDSSAGKLPRNEAYLSPKKYQEDFQNPWDLDLMDFCREWRSVWRFICRSHASLYCISCDAFSLDHSGGAVGPHH